MLVDVALTGVSTLLAHQTYLNTYKEREPGDWPHHRAYRQVRVVVILCCRHGRHVALLVAWQATSLLPLRREGNRE